MRGLLEQHHSLSGGFTGIGGFAFVKLAECRDITAKPVFQDMQQGNINPRCSPSAEPGIRPPIQKLDLYGNKNHWRARLRFTRARIPGGQVEREVQGLNCPIITVGLRVFRDRP